MCLSAQAVDQRYFKSGTGELKCCVERERERESDFSRHGADGRVDRVHEFNHPCLNRVYSKAIK